MCFKVVEKREEKKEESFVIQGINYYICSILVMCGVETGEWKQNDILQLKYKELCSAYPLTISNKTITN